MLEHLKAYAQERHIPIIGDDGLELIKTLMERHQVKNVLEIGTAIGYSAIAMASFGCHVDTFEKDPLMIQEAIHHIELFSLKDNITLLPFDARTYEGPLKTYDLIFIDAAKSQYQTFFDRYTSYLRTGGLVVCDNLSFHHLDPDQVNRHTKHLLRKIALFRTYLEHHKAFKTTFYELGDGMSVSIKETL